MAKPDNRNDNVEKLQHMVQNTIENIEKSEETLQHTTNEETRNQIQSKNARREQSIENFRAEIKDEANDTH